MPKFTDEQLQAINTSGHNIIVSAGAGSGKTEVLSERVIAILKKGIKINELLILTFTNAAAKEMQDRIRKKITQNPLLKDNLDYLESSYITTFDSFTLSLVKKYHYLINVSPNLSILDESIATILKGDIIDNIFTEFYDKEDSLFQHFIQDFCVKNDTLLKSYIQDIIKGLELKSDIDTYLENYETYYYSETKIYEYINEYLNLLHVKINDIETNLMCIDSTTYPEFYEAFEKSLEKLIKTQTYEEILESINSDLPRRPRNSEDIKVVVDNIKSIRDDLKNNYLRFTDTKEIKETILLTRDYVKIIIKIVQKYFEELNNYKKEHDLYEFQDIAKMAINILKDNHEIKEEIKNYYKEIMIDEYQDTSDLQEEFVSLIENDNVYMVGDVKQSIYRFRNANPLIFKDKYNRYKEGNGGIKIDLLKNFRSRFEVLEGINLIFNLIMDDSLGGANYKETHQMNFGNEDYIEYKTNENYNLEVLEYDNTLEGAKEAELEAFIIAKDIKQKLENNYQVFDKKIGTLRKATYADFCIIQDRNSDFPLYKKIFGYLGIPLGVIADNYLTSETEINILNNILGLILKINNKLFDQEFKYFWVSLARSFLFEYPDNIILNTLKNNNFVESTIYQKCLKISEELNNLSNREILELIIQEFNFYENLIKIGDVEESMVRIANLLEISANLSNMGYTIIDFKEYLTKMLEGKTVAKYSINEANSDSVKIMNIHKSKGLEYPVCYFSGYKKAFNDADIKDRFVYDNKYGIITPYFKEGIGSTILKDLFKQKYYLDDVSEKIRLFYVALTRAREKIIIVCPTGKPQEFSPKVVDFNIRLKYRSFLNIIDSIRSNIAPYVKTVDLRQIDFTKDYLYGTKKKEEALNESKEIINYHEVAVNLKPIINAHASKSVDELIDVKTTDTLDLGTKIHKCFEQTDFRNILDTNPYKDKITKFVQRLNIDADTKIYKEHEFVFEDNNTIYHGIIDLVLISNDIKIIDYKLKNIADEKYQNQLNIYYNYLKKIYKDKEIKMYLYSILNDELREVQVLA